MEFPWEDHEERRLLLAAEIDEPEGDDESLGVEDVAEGEEVAKEAAPTVGSPITSHVLAGCNQRRRTSKSTFLPPATTDAVWTRVAFFDRNGVRLVLSNWLNKGSGNPYRTVIQSWYYDNERAVRAVVLWHENGTTWNRWAQC
jgi:hypothetical protein